MEWDDVRLFLAIARARSLSAAAPALALSQPTISRRLRAFEQTIGLTLFQRVPGGVQLTGDGQALLLRAERVEREMLALQRTARAEPDGLSGALRLSAPEWFAHAALLQPATDFVASHPATTIELLGETRLFDLDRGEADMVFRFQHFNSPDVVQRRFVSVRYCLYASAFYLERHGLPTLEGAGAGQRLVAMDQAFDHLADVAWLRTRLPRATFSLRSNSRDLQAAACAQDGGLAVLPCVLAERLGLVRIDLDEPPPGREVWLGYHRDLRRLARLRALVDHLVQAVPGQL
jgi:DNA-binding transcriptional LysR family regulator